MKRILVIVAALALTISTNAQKNMRGEIAANPDLAGGIYTAYTVTEHSVAKAPRGYKPFYISHYGRHGSRYQTAQEKYITPLVVLDQANKDGKLTDLGVDLLRRVRIICEDAEMRAGDLSDRGEQEQRDIAERMIKAYPQVFSNKKAKRVHCLASPFVRSVMSMAAFTEELKEHCPHLEISHKASFQDIHITRPEKNMDTFFKKARQIAKQYQMEHTNDKAFISRIFNDYDYAAKLICKEFNSSSTYGFIGNMHDLAMIIQNFYHLPYIHDVFSEEERYQMWHFFNIRRYLTYGPSLDFGDVRNEDGKLLLRDIIERADKVLSGENNKEAATLRFGHDSAIIPLLAIMHAEGCDGRISFAEIERLPEVWCDSRITPMSANAQFVFYRNKKGDVLVRLLLNEKDIRIPIKSDCYPFYKWENFRKYCVAQCEPTAR